MRVGELQAFGLGMDGRAFDRDSEEFVVGAKAELVCATPMVPAPVCFYGADSEPKMNLNLAWSRRWRLHEAASR